MSGTWNLEDWELRCDECPRRERGIAYESLPPPYYVVEARGTTLWAWNEEHLTMLLDLLEGRSLEEHPYGWFATYVEKNWTRLGYRESLARAIRKCWRST